MRPTRVATDDIRARSQRRPRVTRRASYRTLGLLVSLILCGTSQQATAQATGCRLALIDAATARDLRLCLGVSYNGSWGNSAAESFEPSLAVGYQGRNWVLRSSLAYGFKATRDSTLQGRVEARIDALSLSEPFNVLATAHLTHDELKSNETFFAIGVGPAVVFKSDSSTLVASFQPSVESEDYQTDDAELYGPVYRVALDGRANLSNGMQLQASLSYSQQFDRPLFQPDRLEASIGVSIDTHVPGLNITPVFVFRRDDRPPADAEANDYEVKIGVAYAKKGRDRRIRYVIGEQALRAAPNHEAEELRRLPHDAKLVLSSCVEDWCWVQVVAEPDGRRLREHEFGFVREEVLTREPPP